MDTLIDQAFLAIIVLVTLITTAGLAYALTALRQQRHTPPSSE